MHFYAGSTVKAAKLLSEEFPGGLRITQPGMKTVSAGRLFGAGFGLCFIAIGIAVLFAAKATLPGGTLLLKPVVAAAFGGMGAFILWALLQNLSSSLEIDFVKSELRHFRINAKGDVRTRLTIPFAGVKGVFTEGEADHDDPWITDNRARLIVRYEGRNGRLDALTAANDEITALRDLILTQCLNKQAAPVVNGLDTFITRAKWEWQQRTS